MKNKNLHYLLLVPVILLLLAYPIYSICVTNDIAKNGEEIVLYRESSSHDESIDVIVTNADESVKRRDYIGVEATKNRLHIKTSVLAYSVKDFGREHFDNDCIYRTGIEDLDIGKIKSITIRYKDAHAVVTNVEYFDEREPFGSDEYFDNLCKEMNAQLGYYYEAD